MSAEVKLYHPRGPAVLMTLEGDLTTYSSQVDNLLNGGWLVAPPGLEAGEEKDTVGFVLHGELERDGKATPFLLLYSTNDAMKWSFLKVYLNKLEQIEDFEFASGMKLAQIPVYVGNDKPERGKSSRVDQFIKPTRPFVVVFKANPKWNKEDADAHAARQEIYPVPKRLFVRWADQRPQSDHPEPSGTPTTAHEPSSQSQPAQRAPVQRSGVASELAAWLAKDPTLQQLNDWLPDLGKMTPDTKRECWTMIQEFARAGGLTFDEQTKKFKPFF